MSRSVPGPNAPSHRSTTPARPSGSAGGERPSPSHASMAAQRGREVVQGPSFEARTTRPAAESVLSTRGATGTWPPQRLPSPYVIEPTSSGIWSRSSEDVASRPSESASRTCRDASPSHFSPSGHSPAFSTSRTSLRRSLTATRSLAPAWASASVSRGKTKSVRRMARCLTSERSVYRAWSRSSTPTSSSRARAER